MTAIFQNRHRGTYPHTNVIFITLDIAVVERLFWSKRFSVAATLQNIMSHMQQKSILVFEIGKRVFTLN